MRSPKVLKKRSPCLLVEAQHSSDAFAQFYERYSRSVLIFITRRVFDAELAFDITHETFAIALERRAQFRGQTEQEEQGWLFAIARNELFRYWREGKVERAALTRMEVSVTELEDADIERIEDLAELAQVVPQLHGAVERLPSEQRRAIELRIVSELSYGEVAALLGVSQQVVRARVSRGLRSLSKQLSTDASLEGVA